MGILEGPLDIQEEHFDGLLLLRFIGKLDAMSAPAAEKKSFECINSGHHRLIFDFQGVDFLSSAGMRMLLSTTKKLRALDGRLVLCNINTNVMSVLMMAGFDHVLEISKNVAAAQERLNGSAV